MSGGWIKRDVTHVSVDFTEGDSTIVVEGADFSQVNVDIILKHKKALMAVAEHFDADIIVRPKGKTA